jgi:hypothetical protein
MYKLWMAELATLYCTPGVRESHARYLRDYVGGYTRMSDFFDEVYEVARRNPDDVGSRSRRAAQAVEDWNPEVAAL